MNGFEKAYESLNKQQRQAVDTIDGPVLVIAGPGTGKTQLVTTRIGHILKTTDTLPGSILCLTFTEAGQEAMRERLIGFLGQAAYEVNISTYHAFGSEIIRRYPEYFEVGLEPIDELESFSILRGIIAGLPYSNPLKFADAQLPDILNFISDCKRALLLPDDVLKVAVRNQAELERINQASAKILSGIATVSPKSLPQFEKLLHLLADWPAPRQKLPGSLRPLHSYAAESLAKALEEAAESSKTTPVTAWKNAWLEKDRDGNFSFAGQKQNQKLQAAAGVYGQYQKALAERRFYDYDDMIVRAIEVLEKNQDLKYSLAEQYLYIMLDEFQDTNPAQMRLIELLSDHPVWEGRPNVLAVGDDDQAIYAFQGADHANMAEFARHYKAVKIISLKQNYRSTPEILQTAANVAGQISDRLHEHFQGGLTKDLVSSGKISGTPALEARQFRSDAAQYEWIAGHIKTLLDKQKLMPGEIAVLAPRHRNLMRLLPYLTRQNLPIRYERRDNILDMPLIRQLEQMSRLCSALASGRQEDADVFWPEVLSYDFWGLATEQIWRLSWQAEKTGRPWTAVLLEEEAVKNIALFFLRLKDILSLTTLEQQLDILVGLPEVSRQYDLPLTSPFLAHYFGEAAQDDGVGFTRLLGQLSTLRHHLLQHQRLEEEPLQLGDFLRFVDEHRAAGINILDTNAYEETEQAVHVMTAYAAKGREFTAVFIIDGQDDVWGSASRTKGQYISLPANLRFVRYQGASEDERLRLFYVAITRAKAQLYLSGYTHNLAGKSSTPLKYLDQREDGASRLKCFILPEECSLVISDERGGLSLEAAEDYWSARHQPPFKLKLKECLAQVVRNYQLSATHLNTFTDVAGGGPRDFLMRSLLRFPRAVPFAQRYGTAMHETIRFSYQSGLSQGKPPELTSVLEYFEQRLKRQKMPAMEFQQFLERGSGALTAWLVERGGDYQPNDRYELSFWDKASFVGPAHLTGTVDRLRINAATREIIVTDFKTGQPYHRWVGSNIRLYKYRQQLLIYKLLIESSRDFKGYTVTRGIIEFVEPDEHGQILSLQLDYDDGQVESMGQLIKAVWQHVQELDFPEVGNYPATVAGIKKFEDDLIKKAAG